MNIEFSASAATSSRRCRLSGSLAMVLPLALASAVAAHPPGSDGPMDHEHAVRLERPAPSARGILEAGDLRFRVVEDWCSLPDDRPIGNTHGTLVTDSAGLVYYNTDTDRSVMIHQPDGTFVRSFGPELSGIHDM